MAPEMFNSKKQVFRSYPFLGNLFRDKLWQKWGKSAYLVYIHGCREKAVNTGKCVLGMKELLN